VVTEVGAPYWLCPDAAENYFNILQRLPTDRQGASTCQVIVHYRASASQPANSARISMTSDPLASGGTPGASTGSQNDIADPAQTITTTTLTDQVANTDDYLQVRVGRAGTSGSDTYTGDIYIYGVEIVVPNCLGYVE
jgi:hypothetical protein